MLKNIHHIAVICSNYSTSKNFYVNILGLTIIREVYREERKSYKLDLALNGNFIIELFSFPETPERLTFPEAVGLRHLAFEVVDIENTIIKFKKQGITAQTIQIDEFTNKKYTFIFDPDNLPIELYEQ
jgi:glyoxylase I family protein